MCGYLRNTLAEDQTKTDFNLKSFGHSGPIIWEVRLPTTVRGPLIPLPLGSCRYPGSSPLFLFLPPSTISRMAVPHTELEEVYVCGGGKREGRQGESETKMALKQHIVYWGRPGRAPGKSERLPGHVSALRREPPITEHCFFGCSLSLHLCCALQTGHQLFLPAQHPFLLALAS